MKLLKRLRKNVGFFQKVAKTSFKSLVMKRVYTGDEYSCKFSVSTRNGKNTQSKRGNQR